MVKDNSLASTVCSEICNSTVLVCDDEDFNLDVLSHVLKQTGITSMCFDSG
jgi:CheY-like chemotaxis protein